MADLRPMFRRWQKAHPNFLTSKVLKIEQGDDEWIVELSEGKGILNDKLYVVTVLHYEGKGIFSIFSEEERNQAFNSKQKAETYFKKIVEEF